MNKSVKRVHFFNLLSVILKLKIVNQNKIEDLYINLVSHNSVKRTKFTPFLIENSYGYE